MAVGCVGAKANVKQLALACVWGCFSFAFAKDGKHGLSEIVLSFISCSNVEGCTVAIGLHITVCSYKKLAISKHKTVCQH